MIEIRNRALVTAALVPLLWGLGCSSPPEPAVQATESALVYNSTLSLTLLTVVRGDTGGTAPPDLTAIAFPTFTRPPGTNPLFGGSSSAQLGLCQGPAGGTVTCPGLTLPSGAWTKPFSIDNSQPAKTITYAGELYIQPQGQGAPLFARCFHVGLNTSTLRLGPVPVTSAGCDGQGPNDAKDPVTCDATTCTAKVSVNGGVGPDQIPWTVKFGYKVTPPSNTQTVLITPNYMITNVYYSPPGRSSTMEYQKTTSVGTTLSSGSSFQHSVTQKTEIGTGKQVEANGSVGVTITQGGTWGTTRTDELDVEVNRGSGYSIPGQADVIDHNHDEIWLLLRPQVNATYTSPLDPTLPSSLTWALAANQDGVNNAAPVRVYVGWLNGLIPWNTDVQSELNAHGVTSNDYANILSADPLATGALTDPTQSPGRFAYLDTFSFTPPLLSTDQPAKQPHSVTQKQTNTSTDTAMESYSMGVSISGSGDTTLLTGKFSQEETWTWTDSSSTKLSNGTTIADTLTVGQPAFGYQGPIFLKAYEDTIFKTYAFALVSTCVGGGVSAQSCNFSSGDPLCVWTRWGFEPGESGWNNSTETFSSITTAQTHGGTQSLQISAPTDKTLPASISNGPCFSAAGNGTMDLRGKTYSAWVNVANSTSSYANTQCRLRAFTSNFQESVLPASTRKAPIVPGSWFQLTGVFPSTAVESQIYQLAVECTLPTDWSATDSTQVWYVDDIVVN